MTISSLIVITISSLIYHDTYEIFHFFFIATSLEMAYVFSSSFGIPPVKTNDLYSWLFKFLEKENYYLKTFLSLVNEKTDWHWAAPRNHFSTTALVVVAGDLVTRMTMYLSVPVDYWANVCLQTVNCRSCLHH